MPFPFAAPSRRAQSPASIARSPRRCRASGRFTIRGTSGHCSEAHQPTWFSAYLDERRPPFEDDVVRYYGQYVAVVIAQTFEQADAAASAVKVTYSEETPDVRTHLDPEGEPKVASARGTPDEAFASAAIKLDETYGTPVETHNPIELHASVALWDGQSFTLYETSQGVVNHRDVLAQMLGVPTENVRVVSRFLGSGFGGKLFPWPHSLLAAAASRNLNRPVKLVVSRQMMFQNVGHRPRTQQRVRLSATTDGKFTSLQHDYLNHTSILDDYTENCGEATPYLYGTENLRVTSGLVRRNIGTPTSMRGPGAVPGLFATESAMDELAIKLKMDPVELRLLNEPEKDQSNDLPFSSRHQRRVDRLADIVCGGDLDELDGAEPHVDLELGDLCAIAVDRVGLALALGVERRWSADRRSR